ncbi:hypothetical protein [Candidatus Similichlamydia epinepheli]|uniref:hypothetical protein n=1 Tax=Candidatus Similichlamydia epinepheli TaxID=1903953 RepID=UPI000D3482FB|nr:hypothetical protein [Candidatus Similichlamydia epinepheli]
MDLGLKNLQKDQLGCEPTATENSMTREELVVAMRQMGLTGDEMASELTFPASTSFRNLSDLEKISPVFRESFERATAMAILAETRRFAKRIKDAYRG